nr:MAG TPA: hypothetical protein [Caudoviricetes sp.]
MCNLPFAPRFCTKKARTEQKRYCQHYCPLIVTCIVILLISCISVMYNISVTM